MWARWKLMTAGVLTAALLLGAAAPALAANPQTGSATVDEARWAGGQVTAVGADSFTTGGPRGGEHVIAVTAETIFYDENAQPSSLGALQVGDRVRGLVDVAEDGVLTAKLVVNLGPQTEYAGGGVIATVDGAEQSFVFTSRHGRVWEFYVDSATEITNRAGDDLAFADLNAGDRAAVRAELRDDGKWWAVHIKLGPR
ncbi:MAG: hypothetical protein IT317_10300 [Anaerolineales bacterium]|nr:hypothetical protein [Anaerolineales bacterium]